MKLETPNLKLLFWFFVGLLLGRHIARRAEADVIARLRACGGM